MQDVELPRAIILQPNDGCLTLARSCVELGGRYWTRTSDFLGVSEAL